MAKQDDTISDAEGPITIVPFESCDQEIADQLSKILNYQMKEEYNSILKSLIDPTGKE